MRCFFGLPITGSLKQTAKELKHAYLSNHAMRHILWSPSPNWHLTVRFLGQTSESQHQSLIRAAADIALNTPPLEITNNGILVLPASRPRVFCLSVRLTDPLAELFQALQKASLELGYEPEKRPFLPHITIGRWNSAPKEDIQKIVLPEVCEQINCFHLYKSEPGAGGSVYTPIETFELSHSG